MKSIYVPRHGEYQGQLGAAGNQPVFVIARYVAVSSTNSLTCDFTLSGKKRIGPRTDPWGHLMLLVPPRNNPRRGQPSVTCRSMYFRALHQMA